MPIALVGTKKDLPRKVPDSYGYEKIESWNNELGSEKCFLFHETSSFEDINSVLDLRRYMIDKIINDRLYEDISHNGGPLSTMTY